MERDDGLLESTFWFASVTLLSCDRIAIFSSALPSSNGRTISKATSFEFWTQVVFSLFPKRKPTENHLMGFMLRTSYPRRNNNVELKWYMILIDSDWCQCNVVEKKMTYIPSKEKRGSFCRLLFWGAFGMILSKFCCGDIVHLLQNLRAYVTTN